MTLLSPRSVSVVHVCIVLLLAGAAYGIRPAAAQSSADERAATERRLRELREQIEQDRYRLTQTTEEEQATLQTLKDTDREIAIREELITTYQRRLSQVAQESMEIQESMGALEGEIASLREQYQERAVHAYKYGRLHDVALILAAESINQMLIRARYLRRFAQERQAKLDEIQQASVTLKSQQAQLDSTRARTKELLAGAEAEQVNLINLRKTRRRIVADLQQRRAAIEEDIQQNRAAISRLEEQIKALIAAETNRRRETATPAETAAFAELSRSFNQNRGKLPWPSDGVVTEPFGDLVNPVYGTKTPNPGMLIATKAAAEVRAVFDGTVIQVDIIPEFGTYVTIEHGEYLTVYSNFSMLYVSEGDAVSAGQVIGRAGTDAEPRGNGVFFALFHAEQGAVNPAPWLRAR